MLQNRSLESLLNPASRAHHSSHVITSRESHREEADARRDAHQGPLAVFFGEAVVFRDGSVLARQAQNGLVEARARGVARAHHPQVSRLDGRPNRPGLHLGAVERRKGG